MVTSIIGTFFVKLGANNSIMGALYKGFIATVGAVGRLPLAGIVWFWLGADTVFTTSAAQPSPAPICSGAALSGLLVTGLIIWITEYYTGTDYRPVRSIAQASETGHGTNVIQGLAVSLESTAIPALVIIAGIICHLQLWPVCSASPSR